MFEAQQTTELKTKTNTLKPNKPQSSNKTKHTSKVTNHRTSPHLKTHPGKPPIEIKGNRAGETARTTLTTKMKEQDKQLPLGPEHPELVRLGQLQAAHLEVEEAVGLLDQLPEPKADECSPAPVLEEFAVLERLPSHSQDERASGIRITFLKSSSALPRAVCKEWHRGTTHSIIYTSH